MRIHRDPLYMGLKCTQKYLATNTSQFLGYCGSFSSPLFKGYGYDDSPFLRSISRDCSLASTRHIKCFFLSEKLRLPYGKPLTEICACNTILHLLSRHFFNFVVFHQLGFVDEEDEDNEDEGYHHYYDDGDEIHSDPALFL